MKKGRVYTLNYRRKRNGMTDYRSRLSLLKSGKLRVVVRRTLNNILVQIVSFSPKGDRVLVASSTRELIKYGWKGHRGNLSAAYLLGILCGLKAKKKEINFGILDLGLFRAVKNSSFFAVTKGLLDAGFEVPVNYDAVLKERIFGLHIENYAKKLKGTQNYQRQFARYLKVGLNPEDIGKHVEDVKNKILEKWR